MSRPFLRLRAILFRSRGMLTVVGVWFVLGFLGFHFGGGLDWRDSFLSAIYFEVQPDNFSQGYAFWGQSMLFGFVVAALLRETQENHTERCRVMSGLMKNHTIIVGFTHLGSRLVDHCIANKIPYVLIEKEKRLVDDLIRANEPVIVDDARSRDALPSANITHARRVIIAANNIETALVVTKNARDANPSCRIAARCAIDDLVGVLEKLGADRVYLASLAAFNELSQFLDES
ncbi:MAG: NAD-binding protein [Elusimicrobia bacterium]|nr:NAD-binding protein [Elusimicrobiota bacterium]